MAGSCTIDLLLPFKWKGRLVRQITFAPLKLDHTLRWQAKEYESALHLMAVLSGLPITALRQLQYPDVDIVLRCFSDLLPEHMRASIASAEVPILPGFRRAPEPEQQPYMPAPEPEPEDEFLESEDGQPTIPLDRPGFGPPPKADGEPEGEELTPEAAEMLRAEEQKDEGVDLGL